MPRPVVQLHKALSAIAPIEGVSRGKADDKATWTIHFKPEATDQQKTDARAALLAFTPVPDDPEDIDAGEFTKRERAILVAAALLGGADPSQAVARAKLRFKQAMQLLNA